MNNLIAVGFVCILSGYYFGYHVSNLEFEKQIQESNSIILKMQKDNYEKELKYSYEITELQNEIKKHQTSFSDYLSALNKQSADRLRQSDNRAQYYRKQAEACSTQSREFAEYTSKLDRQLTEGISLVEELTGIIKLRDKQLEFLIKQAQLDRELLND